MDALICGMHRSGTSAVARLLSIGAGASLCDDPPWAAEAPSIILNSAAIRLELDGAKLVKCPRMAGYLDLVLTAFPRAQVVWMLRDPRDIYSSIQERARNAPDTTLLEFREIGIIGGGLSSFTRAYKVYLEVLHACLAQCENRIYIVRYETFFQAKVSTVQIIARWLGLPMDIDLIAPFIDRQLGPPRHKFGAIKGPGRYNGDLTYEETQGLAVAVEGWAEVVCPAP
jgi:hypothetical protein